MPVVTKLARVVTYYEGLPLIPLNNPLTMWSLDVM